MDKYQDKQAAFLTKHRLKKGSKVKIFRAAQSRENGWPDSWVNGEMDTHIGKTVTISEITDSDLFFEEVVYGWPYFVVKPARLRIG